MAGATCQQPRRTDRVADFAQCDEIASVVSMEPWNFSFKRRSNSRRKPDDADSPAASAFLVNPFALATLIRIEWPAHSVNADFRYAAPVLPWPAPPPSPPRSVSGGRGRCGPRLR